MRITSTILNATYGFKEPLNGPIYFSGGYEYIELELGIIFQAPMSKTIRLNQKIRIAPGSPSNYLHEQLIGALGDPGVDYMEWLGRHLDVAVDYITQPTTGKVVLKITDVFVPACKHSISTD